MSGGVHLVRDGGAALGLLFRVSLHLDGAQSGVVVVVVGKHPRGAVGACLLGQQGLLLGLGRLLGQGGGGQQEARWQGGGGGGCGRRRGLGASVQAASCGLLPSAACAVGCRRRTAVAAPNTCKSQQQASGHHTLLWPTMSRVFGLTVL